MISATRQLNLWDHLSKFFAPHNRELRVPTIGTQNVVALQTLMRLREDLPDGAANVTVDFSECAELALSALVFLGGLVSLVKASGGTVNVRKDTIRPKLRLEWEKNGFLTHLGTPSSTLVTDAVPFEHHPELDKDRVMKYLEGKWIGVGAVRLSEDLQAAIIGKVWEIYTNAFEHAESPIGVMNCGRYDKKRHRLHLCVMDFGIGIPDNVRKHKPGITIDSGSAMRWAFLNGSSTKADAVGYSRGLGLHILKEFIRVNKGKLEVYSNDGFVRIKSQSEIYRRTTARFPGTLVNITLEADERFYCFGYEVEKYAKTSGQGY
jgi:anti-sigma regulatory factor (Ser/Thr protein kinase)